MKTLSRGEATGSTGSRSNKRQNVQDNIKAFLAELTTCCRGRLRLTREHCRESPQRGGIPPMVVAYRWENALTGRIGPFYLSDF